MRELRHENPDTTEIFDGFWKKIELLISFTKPKKKHGRPRKGHREIMSGIFISSVQAANKKRCQDFVERPAV